MAPKTRVLRYLRVSTSQQMADDRFGLDRQRITAARSELKHGLEVVCEVIDNISGAKRDRIGLAQLPELALQHSATAVSLSDLDRLSRDLPGGYDILSELIDTRLDIFAADLRARVNFRDIDSVKEVNDRLRDAHLERAKIARRTQDGRIAKAISGKTVRNLNLYGYQNGEIFEPQAVWVRRVFELALDNGLHACATRLDAESAPSPSRTGRGWRMHHVSDILFNTTYMGQAGYGLELHCPDCQESRYGSVYDAKRGHGYCNRCGKQLELQRYYVPVPAIVTPEQWYAAKEARARRATKQGKRGKRLDTYPLTGRAFCGNCGRAMNGMRSAANRYYACSNARRNKDNPCSHHHYYRTDEVHEAVYARLRELVETPGILEHAFAATDTDPYAADRERVEQARAELNAKLERVEEGYLAGALSLKTTLEQRRALESKLAALPALEPFIRPKRDLAGYRARLRQVLATEPLADVVEVASLEVIFEPDRVVRVVVR